MKMTQIQMFSPSTDGATFSDSLQQRLFISTLTKVSRSWGGAAAMTCDKAAESKVKSDDNKHHIITFGTAQYT